MPKAARIRVRTTALAQATERLRRTSRGARLLHASGYLTTLA
jgi:hypothetical protein